MARRVNSRGFRELARLPSYKARGVRSHSLQTQLYLSHARYVHNNPDTPDIGWQVERQLNQKMADARADLAERVKEAATVKSRVRTFDRKSPSIQRKTSQPVKEMLDSRYTGNSPRSPYPKGKGRSTSWSRIIDPAYQLQSGAPSEFRLGSLTGSSATPRTSLTSGDLLSRFNNKKMGQGWAGYPASRLRGGKNLLAHPETFAKRYAAVWIAAEASNALQRHQGWDKVDGTEDPADARRKMGSPKGPGDLIRMGLGTEANIGLQIGMIPGAIFASILAPLFGRTQAQAAQGLKGVEMMGKWFASGQEGDSPIAAINKYNASVMNAVANAQLEAKTKAQKKFDDQIRVGIAAHKDTLALRGAGNVNKLITAFKRQKAQVEERQRVGTAASNNVDVLKVQDIVQNRFFGHLK